jgi:hypothetical protein
MMLARAIRQAFHVRLLVRRSGRITDKAFARRVVKPPQWTVSEHMFLLV